MANKETNLSDMVSANSKRILWALFILVIVILLVFTITVGFHPQLSDRLSTVFIAAISGSLALGGTLISQLWGNRKDSQDTPIAVLKAVPPEIRSGETATLDASSSKNFDKIIIEHKPTAGEPKETLKEIGITKKEFTAPQTKEVKSFVFTAVAKKGDKESKETQVSIEVSPPGSQTPEDTPIAVLKAVPSEIRSGETATLDASSSKNFDKIIIEHKPTAGEPKETLKEIGITKKEFTAPQTKEVKSFVFTAVAKKGDKESKETQVSIEVSPPGSQTPEDTPIAVLKAVPSEIRSGETATLDASSSKNFDKIIIEHKPTAGEPKETLKEIGITKKEFTAPQTKEVKSFVFTAVAKKGDKESKETQVSIEVSPPSS